MSDQKELFIVEGKSAASTVRQALDKKTQRVYAIQGKLINVNKASEATVAANLECNELLECLGCSAAPNGLLEKLNYSRILLVMDPDIDGRHSTALLLSFFARYCHPVVASGLLWIVKPPMYRVKFDEQNVRYAWSEKELQQLLDCTSDAQPATTQIKGVAQFSSNECHQLLLNPETRRQQVISVAVH